MAYAWSSLLALSDSCEISAEAVVAVEAVLCTEHRLLCELDGESMRAGGVKEEDWALWCCEGKARRLIGVDPYGWALAKS